MNIEIDTVSGTASMSHLTWAQASEIPPPLSVRIPLRTLSVPLLLNQPFPTILDTPTLPEPPTCLGVTPVSCNLNTVYDLPIPPRDWCTTLELAAKARWDKQEELVSFQHPTEPGQVLPLGVMLFWQEMHRIMKEQRRWRKAVHWVLQRDESPERVMVINLIERTPWGLQVWIPGLSGRGIVIGAFANLLSFAWLGDRHMDAITAYLNTMGSKTWWAGNIALTATFQQVPNMSEEEIERNQVLGKAKEEIAHRKAKNILLPVNLDNIHWIIVHVDLAKKRYSYGLYSCPYCSLLQPLIWCPGDSLNDKSRGAALKPLYAGLEKWLSKMYPGTWTDDGMKFKIGKQQDSSSCGVCVLNAMDHAMRKKGLFQDARRHLFRIDLFIKLISYLIDKVGIHTWSI